MAGVFDHRFIAKKHGILTFTCENITDTQRSLILRIVFSQQFNLLDNIYSFLPLM